MRVDEAFEKLLETSVDEFNKWLETEAIDIIEEYIKEDVEQSARTWRYARLEAVKESMETLEKLKRTTCKKIKFLK